MMQLSRIGQLRGHLEKSSKRHNTQAVSSNHFWSNACSSSCSWFGQLFGFEEEGQSYEQIKSNFTLDVDRRTLTSKANGRCYTVGEFTTPSLRELRETGRSCWRPGTLIVEHVVSGDILPHHALRENNGATFQAASQFNCLEFASPYALPEMGVTIYADDHTQGPACSIAAGPATVYRNYFAHVKGAGQQAQEGQTKENQLNNLDDLSAFLSSQIKEGSSEGSSSPYFDVTNGYSFSTASKLERLNSHLRSLSEGQLDQVRDTTACLTAAAAAATA
jgi:hypothetical protein